MRFASWLLAAAASSALAACDGQSDPATTLSPTSAQFVAEPPGFRTSQPAQARTLTAGASVTPIISTGDPIPGAESNPDPELRVWGPVPDGLGAFAEGNNLVVYANHEIAKGGISGKFAYARVSRITIDRRFLTVTSGYYPLTGSYLLERLCSATWVTPASGFATGAGTGYFLTGEESNPTAKGSLTVAIDRNGAITDLPWLGRYAHENTISVPGFKGRTVLLGFDDTNGASELYLYVAKTAADVLAGNGKLYAFTTDGSAHAGDLQVGQTITGDFLEIPWTSSQTAAELQTAVDNLGTHGAFPFVRLEDGDFVKNRAWNQRPMVYFVDTGNTGTTGRIAPGTKTNVTCQVTPCDAYGSIYSMELNGEDPTKAARLTLVARSKGVASGDWASPDNIAVGRKSLMLQEDPAYGGFDRAEQIWQFPLQSNGTLGNGQAVVELTNEALTGVKCVDANGTCWESSGIIDASEWLGGGTWLFDVQAHTLPFTYLDGTTTVSVPREAGQLLLLKLPGS